MASSTPLLMINGTAGATALAGVGTTLAGAAAITAGSTLLSTSAGQVAFVLPSSYPLNTPIFVATTTATTATIFPGSSSQQINGATAGTAYSVAQGKGAVFIYMGGNQWLAVAA